jgi:hypothetical protein
MAHPRLQIPNDSNRHEATSVGDPGMIPTTHCISLLFGIGKRGFPLLGVVY